MADAGDIRAGRAFVELTLKDGAFVRGLSDASKRLRSFSTEIAEIGAIIAAAGSAIVGPLIYAVKTFENFASKLKDMSDRTGVSVESLSELSHAAEQSGTSIETVEMALLKLATQGKKIEDFDRYAALIAAIEDPSKKAAKAIELFGKSGPQLIPMLDSLQALREEARELGFVLSSEDAAAAEEFGDMLGNLSKSIRFMAITVGAAIVPAMKDMIQGAQRVATSVGKWVRENQHLFGILAKIGIVLVATGSVVMGLALAFKFIAIAIGGVAALLSTIATVLGLVFSPIGLIVAALIGSVYAWSQFTKSGRIATNNMFSLLAELGNTFSTTFGGIMDALRAGNLALAGQIAITGLKVAMLQGIAKISKAFGGAFGDMIGGIGKDILGGNFKGAWKKAVKAMAMVWDIFTGGIIKGFASALEWVIKTWKQAVKNVSGVIIDSPMLWSVFGDGTDLDERQKEARDQAVKKVQEYTDKRDLDKVALKQAKEAEAKGQKFMDPEFKPGGKQYNADLAPGGLGHPLTKHTSGPWKGTYVNATLAPGGSQHDPNYEYGVRSSQEIEDSIKENERLMEYAGQNLNYDIRKLISGGVSEDIDLMAGNALSVLDLMKQQADADTDKSTDDFKAEVDGGANAAQMAADAAVEELRKLREQAAAEAARAAAAARNDDANRGKFIPKKSGEISDDIFGAFSGAALRAGADKPELNELKQINKHLKDIKQKKGPVMGA